MTTGNKEARNAQYWAVGYTNGGANETRLGPFAEQSDAIKAGMTEQGKTRGFTLSGVVDESGKYVYSNAKACNAKFKVGDRVRVRQEAADVIENPALARKTGKVIRVLPGGYYEVDGELGATGLELSDAELISANSALNAKFKVGDKVISKSRKYLGPAKITDETDDEYVVKFDNGMRDMLEKDDVVAANAALNAKFNVGDKVKFWVFDKKADGTVKKVVGEKVTVDDGKGNEVEFPAKDLEVWNAGSGRVKGFFVWFSPRSGLAAKAADDIVRKVSGAKTRGANIIEVGDEASAQKVYDLFRKAKVPAKDLNVGYNSCVASANSVVANAMAANGNKVACNIQSEYEITYKDGFKEWRESYGGRDLWRQTYTMRQIHGDPVKFKTDDGKEVPLREVMGNSEGAVANAGGDTKIGSVDIYAHDDGSYSYVLAWHGDEGSMSGHGDKARVVAKVKKDISTLRAKIADLEKVAAYFQGIK